MKKIPVIMFAGFLGSGKTTVIGRMLPELAAGNKVALLVNDFGKYSLDGALLKTYGIPTLEIAGGSIFCICKQANLINQLTTIAENLHPDLLVIEASGLAEPTDTAALLQNSFLRDSFLLPRVVTVVDALNYPKLSKVLPVINKQIAIADIIVISKCDLASGEISENLKQVNPDAGIILSDREKLHGNIKFDHFSDCSQSASLRLCSTSTPGFSTINWDGSLPEEVLNQLMTEYRGRLLRGKGVVNGRHLELVNGSFTWSDDPPAGVNGVFFALTGDYGKEFLYRLKQKEKELASSAPA